MEDIIMLSVEQVAKELNISVSYVNQLKDFKNSDPIPYLKSQYGQVYYNGEMITTTENLKGKTVVFIKEDIEKWKKRQ